MANEDWSALGTPVVDAPAEDWSALGTPVKDPKQNTSLAGDIGTGMKRGVLQMPGMVTGLADLATTPIALATGVNRPISKAADWAGEKTGFQPEKWAKNAEAEYSPEMQQAQANVEAAQGFFPTLGAVAENPRVAAQLVAESLPSTLAGGVLARGAMGMVTGAGKLAALRAAAGSADAVVANAAKAQLLKAGAIAAGIGEGAVTAGQQMSQTGYEVDPALAAGTALAAGVGTGLIGAGSGRLANSAVGKRLGLSDIETSMAAGTLGENAGKAGLASYAKRIGAGTIQEGLLEEAPQSYQEQVWQNLASGKPWDEGAASAAAQGAIAGGLMGGTVNAIPRKPEVAPPPAPAIPDPSTGGTFTPDPNGGVLERGLSAMANARAEVDSGAARNIDTIDRGLDLVAPPTAPSTIPDNELPIVGQPAPEPVEPQSIVSGKEPSTTTRGAYGDALAKQQRGDLLTASDVTSLKFPPSDVEIQTEPSTTKKNQSIEPVTRRVDMALPPAVTQQQLDDQEANRSTPRGNTLYHGGTLVPKPTADKQGVVIDGVPGVSFSPNAVAAARYAFGNTGPLNAVDVSGLKIYKQGLSSVLDAAYQRADFGAIKAAGFDGMKLFNSDEHVLFDPEKVAALPRREAAQNYKEDSNGVFRRFKPWEEKNSPANRSTPRASEQLFTEDAPVFTDQPNQGTADAVSNQTDETVPQQAKQQAQTVADSGAGEVRANDPPGNATPAKGELDTGTPGSKPVPVARPAALPNHPAAKIVAKALPEAKDVQIHSTDSLSSEKESGATGRMSKWRGKTIERMARVFGNRKVVFFSSSSPAGSTTNGMTYGADGVLYINIDAGVDPIAVVGHEWRHALRYSNAAAHAAINQAATKLLDSPGRLLEFAKVYHGVELAQDDGGSKDTKDLMARIEAGEATDEDKARLAEEFSADITGNLWRDPKALREVFDTILEQHPPSAARTIIKSIGDAILKLIDKLIISTPKGKYSEMGISRDELLGLKKEIQAAMADSFKQDVQRRLDKVRSGQGGEVKFATARKPGSDIGHKRENESGRYVGAPDWVGNAVGQIAVLRKKLRGLAKDGEPGRFWYENSSKAILELVNGDKNEAEKLVQLIAIYSPSNAVPGNTTMAVKAYYQWKQGLPIRVGTGNNDSKANELLYEGKEWGGIKTNSFYQNLMQEIDPSKNDTGTATMDMWMALAFDYGMKVVDQGPKYRFMEREIQRLARELTWTPHQVQAAIWTGMKGRIDPIRGALTAAELDNGWHNAEVTAAWNAGEKVAFATRQAAYEKAKAAGKKVSPPVLKLAGIDTLNSDRKKDHYKLAHKMGMVHNLRREDVEASKYDFSDAIKERTAQMSWEATPGASTGVLPGIHDAPMSQQQEYLAAQRAAFTDDKGNDIIGKEIGIAMAKSVQGFSGWKGISSVGVQDGMVIPTNSQEGGLVQPVARNAIDLFAAVRGLVLAQEGVAWHYPIYTGSKNALNGVKFDIGRLLTEEESANLYKALSEELGHTFSPPIATQDGLGFRVLNFPDEKFALKDDFSDKADLLGQTGVQRKTKLQKSQLEKNKEFRDAVYRAVERQAWKELTVGNVSRFESDGNLVENDWSNGDGDYRERIREATEGFGARSWAGRSDIFEWIDRDLRPKAEAVNKEFADKYGWGKQQALFSPARSDAAGSPGTRGGPGQVDEGTRPGSVSGTGVHYSKQQRSTLDSSFFGTGLKGDELPRVTEATDPRLKHRIYFYLNTGKGIKPEAGVGIHAHQADLSNIYDATNDTRDLVAKYAGKKNEFESALLDSGYDGYMTQSSGVAILLGERSQPVEYLGTNDRPDVDQAGTAEKSDFGKLQRSVVDNKALPSGEMTGADWKRMMPKLMPEIDVSHLADDQRYYKDGLVKRPEVRRSPSRVQTETPEFKKWFAGSAVADNGFAELLSKPDGARVLADDLLAAQGSAGTGLDTVQALMLALSQNDKIGPAIVRLVPVDVVNSLAEDSGISKNARGDRSMLIDALHSPVSDEILSSLRSVLTRLSTELARALDASSDKEIAPALRASDLNLREVGGLLSLQSSTDLRGSQSGVSPVGASKSAKSSATLANSPPLDSEQNAAAFARLLDKFMLLAPHAKDSITDKLPTAKIIALQGKPLVVYHSTNADWSEFDPMQTLSSFGFHAGTKEQAKAVRETGGTKDDVTKVRPLEGLNVMPVYLSMRNPLRMEDKGTWYSHQMIEDLAQKGIKDRSPLPENARDLAGYGASHMSVAWDRASEARKRWDLAVKTRMKAWRAEHPDAGREAYDDEARVTGRNYVRDLLAKNGYDGIVYDNKFEGKGDSYIAFEPTQIKSATGNNGQFNAKNPDIRRSTPRGAITNQPINQSWQDPDNMDKWDTFVRTMADKMWDTKKVLAAIRAAGIAIKDTIDPYLQEVLYHGRAAKRVSDFADNELRPMLVEMGMRKIERQELEDYLWARHATERNAQIAKINPKMPDGGSGLTNQQAADILAGQTVTVGKTATDPGRDIKLTISKMPGYRSLAAKVDAITKETTDTLVRYGLETQDTVDSWRATYGKYVPLMRDMEADDNYAGAFNLGLGTGQGFSVRGSASKRSLGSERGVIDILANVAMQRERAIVRGEKNRVAQSMYGLAITAPNPDFWLPLNPDANKDPAQVTAELVALGLNPIDAANIASEPKQRYTDPNTGMVMERINPQLRSRGDVLAVRINGKDRYVMFSSNERAQKMVAGLKNLDVDQLGMVMQKMAVVTRWFAAINTQYNPVFGLTNGIRDLGTGMLNLTSTELKGQQAEVFKNAFSALRGVYADLRDHRAGRTPTSKWALEFEEFALEGGQTGYRDMFQTSRDRTEGLMQEFKDATKGKTLLTFSEKRSPLFGWLSDYNTSIENAIRLSAYKAAKDKGMTKAQAASLAKNLTVNFNKKGLAATQLGAMYAFFNAAAQGTARIGQTLVKVDNGKFSLTGAGKKIVYGGMMAGVLQAAMFAAAGYDDEEPPQFIREKNFIIPMPNGKYLSIPYPLGFHVIPNIGRVSAEFALGGFKNPGKRLVDMFSMIMDGFNPIGGSSGGVSQMLSPTVTDPLVALSENKDWTGKSIYKEDFNSMHPTAGWTRKKDTASDLSRWMAYGINYLTGGGKYEIGLLSPTPDQLDYLIGQATGGVGRESLKAWQAAATAATGENMPMYKVPIAGRFVGETTGQASENSKFYNNLKRIGEHKAALDEMQKAHDLSAMIEYRKDNPDAALVKQADKASTDISDLKRRKRELLEKGASPEQIRMMEEMITTRVRSYNGMLSARS